MEQQRIFVEEEEGRSLSSKRFERVSVPSVPSSNFVGWGLLREEQSVQYFFFPVHVCGFGSNESVQVWGCRVP